MGALIRFTAVVVPKIDILTHPSTSRELLTESVCRNRCSDVSNGHACQYSHYIVCRSNIRPDVTTRRR